MRLLETYSRNCSVEIKHKPEIYEKFFPIPPELTKYITLQNSSGMPAKNYSYWQEVVDILFPILDKHKIRIVTLGDKDSPFLNKTLNLCGQTSIHQSVYILNRALLHMGNDSILGHISCANDINTVLLYGSTTIDNHSPYHYNPNKSIFIESHRNGNKATFAREESPKTIDLIYPEKIAESVCKLLDIPFTYEYKTVNIGYSYHNKLIESGCTDVVNIGQIGIPHIIMRLDYNFNLGVLIQQLSIGKTSIITDKAIPFNIIQHNKHNILEVLVEIKDDKNLQFVAELYDNRIPFRLYSFLDDDKINALKLKYMDYGIIFRKTKNKPEFLKDKNLSQLYYKSSKITLSNGKIFSSRWAQLNNLPQQSFESVPQLLKENKIDELWLEEDYCLFLEKI